MSGLHPRSEERRGGEEWRSACCSSGLLYCNEVAQALGRKQHRVEIELVQIFRRPLLQLDVRVASQIGRASWRGRVEIGVLLFRSALLRRGGASLRAKTPSRRNRAGSNIPTASSSA